MEYDPSDADDLLRFAKRLVGKRVVDLMETSNGSRVDPVRTKSAMGDLVEEYFGLPKSSAKGPDFAKAGIELKVVPLVKGARGFRIKERTKITHIDFEDVFNTAWERSAVRAKTRNVLFVFYVWRPGVPAREFIISHVLLWRPSAQQDAVLMDDYGRVRLMIAAGKAQDITEADASYMGACTAGKNSKDTQSQPKSTLRAKRRAFALKPTFTSSLWLSTTGALESVADLSGSFSQAERRILAKFKHVSGKTVRAVAMKSGVGLQRGKAKWSALILALLGGSGRRQIAEIEALGVKVKTIRVSEDGMPHEAVSFPAFEPFELADEEWDSSIFLSQIRRILFVPLWTSEGSNPERMVFGEPFFWSPDEKEILTCKKEWESVRDSVRAGDLTRLPKSSETKILHIRPHGRDGRDKVDWPDGKGGRQRFRRSSFWLNAKFIKSKIRR